MLFAPQRWEFYAALGFLFLTLAFPGFVWRYLRRRHLLRRRFGALSSEVAFGAQAFGVLAPRRLDVWHAMGTADAAEGRKAFAERRTGTFTGR